MRAASLSARRAALPRGSRALQRQPPQPGHRWPQRLSTLPEHGGGAAAAGGSTHFGFTEVPVEEKTAKVKDVFYEVAERYDVMNDLMSAGLHRCGLPCAPSAPQAPRPALGPRDKRRLALPRRLWKDEFIRTLSPQPGMQLLDLAGGTADIAFRAAAAARALGRHGEQSGTAVTVCDINEAMLAVGRQRAAERGEGLDYSLEWVTADAEQLPFADASFDAVTISFGIRNVTRIDAALREAHRVLRHGGRFLCLEFGPTLDTAMLDDVYQAYSFSMIPSIGLMIVGDRQPYVSNLALHLALRGRLRLATTAYCAARGLRHLHCLLAFHDGVHVRDTVAGVSG